jgi:hypothetical protein
MSRTTKRRPSIDNAAIAALELRVARLIVALQAAERLAEELYDYLNEGDYRHAAKGLDKLERDEYREHSEELDENVRPDLQPLVWQLNNFAGFMEGSIWSGQIDRAREANPHLNG